MAVPAKEGRVVAGEEAKAGDAVPAVAIKVGPAVGGTGHSRLTGTVLKKEGRFKKKKKRKKRGGGKVLKIM